LVGWFKLLGLVLEDGGLLEEDDDESMGISNRLGGVFVSDEEEEEDEEEIVFISWLVDGWLVDGGWLSWDEIITPIFIIIYTIIYINLKT